MLAEWASVTAVISGLMATVLLTGAILLAQEKDGERVPMVMAALGLAAGALFGSLLASRLILEFTRAVPLLRL